MVWGDISARGKTDLVPLNTTLNANRYITEVLTPQVHVLSYADAVGGEYVLIDTPQRARVVTKYLANEGVVRVKWPANSPDLKPMENLWDKLKQAVFR